MDMLKIIVYGFASVVV